MKNVLVGVVAALALSWTDPATAQQAITGNGLLEHVAGAKRVEAGAAARDTDFVDFAYLAGFAQGVAMTLQSLDPQVCLPAGSGTGQYVRVLVQFLEANPSMLHLSGVALAVGAFRQAFPCRKP